MLCLLYIQAWLVLNHHTGMNVFEPIKRLFKRSNKSKPRHTADTFAPDLWALVSLSKTDYIDIYQLTMERVAVSDYGQSLTEEERHELFSYAIQALKVRRGFFLPPDTPPELIFRESEMWTFAVFYTALLSLYTAKNTDKSFLKPFQHLSPIAESWMKKRPSDAAKNYIKSGTGELSPVFTRLSKEIERQRHLENEELSVDAIQRTLPPLIAHYVEALIESEDHRYILLNNGYLILTTENIDQLSATVRQNLKTDLSTALRSCEGQGSQEIDYCLNDTHDIKHGFLLSSIFYQKSADKSRRVFIQKDVAEFAHEFRQHNSLTQMTMAAYCKRLIRYMAKSNTCYSLSCLRTPFSIVSSGICVELRFWRELLDHFRELASTDSELASTDSLDRLVTLSTEGNQCLSLHKERKPVSCVHIIDPYYSKANISPTGRLLVSLSAVNRTDFYAQFESYCKKLIRLKENKYLYQCENGHFMPHHAFEVFTLERLCTHAHWKEVAAFASNSENSSDFFNIETAIVSKEDSLNAISGIYFYNATMDLSSSILPKAATAKPLDSIDWRNIDDLCRESFGSEKKQVAVSEFKEFVLQELVCSDSYIAVSEAMNRHTAIRWETDPNSPDTLLYQP